MTLDRYHVAGVAQARHHAPHHHRIGVEYLPRQLGRDRRFGLIHVNQDVQHPGQTGVKLHRTFPFRSFHVTSTVA
jgi:hypothetical protein